MQPSLLGRSCVRRIPLEFRAGSEPNFQPELDKTSKSGVSTSDDPAERAVGPSIREDVLRPHEIGVVANKHKIRPVNRVRIESTDVARAKDWLTVVENILHVCPELNRDLFCHSGLLEE